MNAFTCRVEVAPPRKRLSLCSLRFLAAIQLQNSGSLCDQPMPGWRCRPPNIRLLFQIWTPCSRPDVERCTKTTESGRDVRKRSLKPPRFFARSGRWSPLANVLVQASPSRRPPHEPGFICPHPAASPRAKLHGATPVIGAGRGCAPEFSTHPRRAGISAQLPRQCPFVLRREGCGSLWDR